MNLKFKFNLFIIFTPISYVLVNNYLKKHSSYAIVIYGPRLNTFRFNPFLSFKYNPFSLILLFPIILLFSNLKILRIWIPHNGSRVLKLINNLCSTNYFTDDGTSAITGIKANVSNKKINYLLTFTDYRHEIKNLKFIYSTNINKYILNMNKYKSNFTTINKYKSKVCVIQSYSINHKVWNTILSKYKYNEITSFLHPFSFKNRNIPKSVKYLIPALPESIDCYLSDLFSYKDIYIGRSFTTITLLNTLSLKDTVINVCLDVNHDHLDKMFYLFLKKNYQLNKNLNYVFL